MRQAVQRNTFTGKTYNSLENISQFFNERGVAFPKPAAAPARRAAEPRRLGQSAAQGYTSGGSRRRCAPGQTVKHPKYGTGVVVRREGEGDDAKITVSFPRYGLKKLIEKFAGLT